MTKQININTGESVVGVSGALMTPAGNPWTVPDALANDLVQREKATPSGWAKNPLSVTFSAAVAAAVVVVVCASGDPSQADANTAAIQAGLDAAGLMGTANTEVRVHAPGSCYTGMTLEQWPHTKITTSPGTYLKRVTTRAGNWVMLHNRGAQLRYKVNGAVISGGFITVAAPGHPFTEGTQVYANNWKGNTTLNGFKTLVNVVPGVSYQYAAGGANPTNAANELIDVVRASTLPGTAFVRTGNVTVVADPGHRRQPGDGLWVAAIPVVGATFNGAIVITDIVPGVSWSYANTGTNETGTGTALVLGDRNIEYDLCLDGSNSAGGPYAYVGAPANATEWGNIAGVRGIIREATGTQGGRVCNHFNARAVDIPLARGRKNCSVLLQFDSYCDKVTVGVAEMEGSDDDTVAVGVTSAGAYTETVPPCGPGNNGTVTVGTISGVSATGLLKVYCAAGFVQGTITVTRVTGTGIVTIGDASAGVGGGTLKAVYAGFADNAPASAGTHAWFVGQPGAFSSMGPVKFGTFVDDHQLGAGTAGSEGLYIRGPMSSVTVDHLVGRTARTASPMIRVSPAATAGTVLKIGEATTICAVLEVDTTPLETLIVDNWTHLGAGTENVLNSGAGGGYVQNVICGNFKGKNVLRFTDNSVAAAVQNFSFNHFELDSVASVFACENSGTYTFKVRGGKVTNVSNNVLQFFTGSTTVNFIGDLEHPAGKLLLATAGPVYRINSRTALFDAGAAGLTLAPAANDEICNTGAAFNGATGAGRYIRNAANSAWVKVA